ncbi:hypothetical protein TPA0909_31000 [Streptomyces albus]|nr:hypothetical protein TPA0909_31000 [Streptomyces albus]
MFREAGARTVLGLGTGHGRDALHFAREDFNVSNLDGSDLCAHTVAAVAPALTAGGGQVHRQPEVLGFSRVAIPPLPGGGTPWA